ncbi:MAG: type II toxin-antitoxin system VapB family antitoxin [Ectothiorhodospiraceae bacterium]|jgi:antitoxin VapB|nr:type II toxin-antitoxin system VapB family antitoxin [Ectothiorhodospiraceae bacterium]
MATARIFKSGNSQAVRLPKEFRVEAKELEIFRRGDEIVLREKRRSADDILKILEGFSDDFMADGRDDPPAQERAEL